MESFNKLSDIAEEFNQNGISSYGEYKTSKDEIRERINKEPGYLDLLKQDITYYLYVLLETPYYYRQIEVNRLDKEIKYHLMYLLCTYLDELTAYRNLPIFLKLMIDRLNIEKYKYVTVDQLKNVINETFKVTKGIYNDELYIDENSKIVYDHEMFEISIKTSSIKYEKYADRFNYAGPRDLNDINDKFIWAEHKTFIDEKHYLEKLGYVNFVLWASRDSGDGFGFDILSFDPFKRREKLIEVKARSSESFEMTENEVKVMREAHLHNADYYVYKYNMHKENFPLDKIRYIPETDELIDEEGNHYEIGKLIAYYDDIEDRNKSYIPITKKEKEKVLENTNKS